MAIMLAEQGLVNLQNREATQALAKSEAKFRALVESSNDWIWETNKDGVYTYSSPQVEGILGYKSKEIIGRTPFDFMPPDEAKQMIEIFKSFSSKGESIVALENVNLHKNNRRIILETSGVPVFDDNGTVIGYRGIDRDISERKLAEEKLQTMQRLKSIGLLAGGIAHDFNNILMGLYGNISLAKEMLASDNPAFEFLEDAEKSMSRATFLTKQLLTFSKGGAPIRENVDIVELIKEITFFDLSGSNVKSVFNHADDLWMAEVDKGQIQQVFSNLVINAVQAMPNGGFLYITLKNVTISENAVLGLNHGKYIKIIVKDGGVGIEKHHIDKIFDPYFTVKKNGNGLGLATTYSIITKHDGYISVDSELNKGTVFTLYLPASELQKLTKPGKSDIECPIEKQPARILVMDDEEIIRDVTSKMLKRLGYYVQTVSDGSQAIDLYKQSIDAGEPFDIILMDLTVPGGMGGKESVKEILKIDPMATVVVSTGYAEDPVIINYSEYGFKGIIIKPYILSKLEKVLNQVLNLS